VTNIAQRAAVVAKNVYIATANTLVALFSLFTMMLPPEWVFVSGEHPKQYPLMACPNNKSTTLPLLLRTTFAYAAFGGIHCIAWNFASYSWEVQVLWRAASLSVTLLPLPSILFAVLYGSEFGVSVEYFLLLGFVMPGCWSTMHMPE
jgi:hypothetical protein